MPLAKLGDININYRVEGKGDPFVMIMGFSASMIGWHFQIQFFRKHYRVITFDNRGVGKSDKPKGPYTTRMMADDTVHLMDHLVIEKAHIMGASMGGMIAQELAINHPERVNKLVLACTYAKHNRTSGINPEMVELSQLPPEKMAPIVLSSSFNKPFYRFVFGPLSWLNSMFMGASTAIGIKGQSAACMNHNTLERLESITADTLVIVGTDDRLINPASSEMIANRIPRARFVKIEGGSHTFMVEMRDDFNREVLKFLSNGHAS